MNVSVLLFDVVAAAILLSVALLGAYLPVVLSRMGEKSGAAPTRNLAYVLGNMLSAGVMVSAGFVHLLGTAIRELDPYQQFPLAPFLCGLGFMLTLLADRIAETLSERAGWDGLTPCGSGDTHLDHEAALLRVVVSGTPSRTSDRGEGRENGALGRDKDASAGPGLVLRSGAVLEAEPLPDREVAESKRLSLEIGDAGDRTSGRGQAGSSGDRRGEANGTQTQLLQRTASRGRLKAQEVADAESPGGQQRGVGFGRDLATIPVAEDECLVEPGQQGSGEDSRAPEGHPGRGGEGGEVAEVSFLTAALMAVALCFHSLLEGAAMGAQVNILDTLHIFIAIAAHKGLAAYALGSSVVDSRADKQKFWIVIASFAAATPVGIFVGYALQGVAQNDAAAAVSALASGTFLYVAFMEVIPRELASPHHKTLKLGMLFLGFGLMSLLGVWA